MICFYMFIWSLSLCVVDHGNCCSNRYPLHQLTFSTSWTFDLAHAVPRRPHLRLLESTPFVASASDLAKGKMNDPTFLRSKVHICYIYICTKMCNIPSPLVGLPKLTQTVRLSLTDLQTSLLPPSKGSRFQKKQTSNLSICRIPRFRLPRLA